MPEITLETLNALAASPARTVEAAEREYHAKIAGAAREVVTREARAVLLAGPSGAGKTTTANLLADAIREAGHAGLVVSLDDFYLDSADPRYPRFADGSRNMECAEALDLDAVRETLGNILAARPFSVPKYDFKCSARTGMTEYPALTDGCVIIEGLHALNPQITGDLSTDALLRIFVSVSTNLVNSAGERLFSGRNMRFVRRLVRDSLYRGATAEHTLTLWRQVLAGEDAYLYPYKGNAELYFDTFHTFEPGVMRPFAERVMTEESLSDPYMQKIAAAMAKITPISDTLVPETSLIREFIPGGKYEYLY
ncbi:MAG TPA: hypothetical protein DDY70_05220 [Clostridiales bacterium]|nr:hypothetical protein [Clostridiales bacterium]